VSAPNRPARGTRGADQGVIRRKARYGIDAGYLLPLAGVVSIALVVAAALSGAVGPLIAACVSCVFIGTGLHSSRRGKFLVWEEVLDGLQLRGDERVLDLGCGRGAVLLAAARRLPRGRGVGIDIWSRADQSGNTVGATLRNAEAENVSERIAALTADMMALPFRSETFDVVVSNVAIHNIRGRSGRAKAIDEAARVLRPGGRLLIADLAFTGAYAGRLVDLGMAQIDRRSLGWRMWWGGPWRATYLVTATKPEGGSGRSG
jgi:ubiquinone/menaquinone biosynthesis C-methylase UbiE